MKWLMVLVLAVAVAVGGWFGFQRWSKTSSLASAADAELTRQSGELEQCKKRLGAFHSAWKRYRADHKGSEPPTIEALMPKYIKSPGDLVCPTAQRWTKGGGMVDQGSVKYRGKSHPETYGFKWLAAGYNRFTAGQGTAAPLIVCAVHREVVYRATYKKAPPIDAFGPEKRGDLVKAVLEAPVLAVRKNGQVAAVAAEDL